jgi:hypothetical protein
MANSLSLSSSSLSIKLDVSAELRCNSKVNQVDNNDFAKASINDTTNKCRLIASNACQLTDELLEIQQIEYEQGLIIDQIKRVDSQKQQLQELLKRLQSTKTTRKKKPLNRYLHLAPSDGSNSDLD